MWFKKDIEVNVCLMKNLGCVVLLRTKTQIKDNLMRST